MSPTTPTPGELSACTISLTHASSAARPVKSSTGRGQLTGAGRCSHPVIPQPSIACQLNELRASVPRQRERIRQRGHGPLLRPLAAPPLHIRQCSGHSPGHLGELLQRQSRRAPVTAQHLAETGPFSDGLTPLSSGGTPPTATGLRAYWGRRGNVNGPVAFSAGSGPASAASRVGGS